MPAAAARATIARYYAAFNAGNAAGMLADDWDVTPTIPKAS